MVDLGEQSTHFLYTPLFGAIKPIKNYVFGGFGGIIATCIVQPIDIIKTRIIIASESRGLGMDVSTKPIDICKKIVSEKGFTGFYSGLGGGVLR